jgi:hypothetical protein
MRRVLYTLVIVMVACMAKADCLACWELIKVDVVLKNGQTMHGYVYWNESWIGGDLEYHKLWINKFPQSYLEVHRKSKSPVYLVTKLTTIKNDSLFEFQAITKADQRAIQISDVSKITEIKGAKRYQGAGELPTYTLSEMKRLNTNPYATYHEEGPVSDAYFMSYDPKITRQQIKALIDGNMDRRKLPAMGIIEVSIGFD